MNLMFWAIMTVIFIIVEIITIQLVSVWLAVGAFATLLCVYFFDIPFLAQLAVFIIVSAICLAITIPLLRKRLNKGYIPTNQELDIGKKATVTEEINLDKGTGRVMLNGVGWNAVSLNGEVIQKESIVIIDNVQGTKVIVHKSS